MRIYVYSGYLDDNMYGLIDNKFPSKPGQTKHQTLVEFWNSIKKHMDEHDNASYNCIGNELIVNALGHMISKGFLITPIIFMYDEFGDVELYKFDSEGYLVTPGKYGVYECDMNILVDDKQEN